MASSTMSAETERLRFYSERCLLLLRNAVEKAESASAGPATNCPKSRYADSSSSDDDNQGGDDEANSSSSSSENDEAEQQQEGVIDHAQQEPLTGSDDRVLPPITGKIKKTQKTKTTMSQRQMETLVRKHFSTLTCIQLSLPAQDFPKLSAPVLQIPVALLRKHEFRSVTADHNVQPARAVQALATSCCSLRPVVVLFLRTGRFAGAVFQGPDCVTHRTLQRYTVRRGQGKAQSTQDAQRSKAKSMGAQLRRAGEVALQQDVTATLMEWNEFIKKACLVLLSCPKTMKKNLFEGTEAVWSRDDDRIRRVPLDMGRPTFEHVCLIHATMMTVMVREASVQLTADGAEQMESSSNGQTSVCLPKKEADALKEEKKMQEPVKVFPELLEIHVAAYEGDLERLRDLLTTKLETVDVNHKAGPDWLTPLHFAAESTVQGVDAVVAADCVALLLELGRANPSILDIRGRPPYYLAVQEKVRDSFRIVRATLGEEYCRWDEGAKVGPPLTAQDIQARKDKEAEKRRIKKARQKEKKAKEKAQVDEAERARQTEEDRRKQEAEAKRIRDGLQPKVSTSSGNTCDFCQTVCKGRRRAQMFRRLDYAYCSTGCVEKHKRELMAAAALARLGGS
jgi:hypothetical protein